MRITDRQIKGCFARQSGFSGRRGKLEETIQRSKEAFYEREAEHVCSSTEFIYWQGRYIRKRWWVLQAVLLFVLWWILKYTDSNYYIQRCMGIVAALFVVTVMPELWKSRNYNAMEVEYTTYYSLRQIYATRLLYFATVDLFLLSVFFAAATNTARTTAWELVIQFLLPLNVTWCICFRTLYSKRVTSEVFALFLCILWTAIWEQIVLNEKVYGRIAGPVWAVLVLTSVLYLGYCIWMGQKKCEEGRLLSWN